ncbi:hypothetical protein GCM10025771_31520 [Niveibacterium umoris]|uniref:Peptidase C58 YopT-type domain-containing protein n=1 Tax=Niveibacterium umoris TaxID=1193620 RepID=A0A840BJ83_9RHOO|nr:YopT-type cysteine protease domain-containing protein [Niveibacterium umoris]MBB4011652.1 hypothetical protein [Niveibacterium umoris]
MASVYAQSATNLGGSCSEFEQTVYINATGWNDPDPKKRGGAFQAGKGLGDGVCSALSAMYLGSRADWSVFKNAIVSPGGLAHIRGLQNLNIHAGNIGSFNFDNISQVYQDVMRLFGVSFSGQQRTAQNSEAAEGAIGMVRQDGLYYFSFWGPFGGHTVALAKKGDAYKAFDPNFGDATLPDAAAFSRFVSWWIPSYYPGINRWFVQRYFS